MADKLLTNEQERNLITIQYVSKVFIFGSYVISYNAKQRLRFVFMYLEQEIFTIYINEDNKMDDENLLETKTKEKKFRYHFKRKSIK